VYLSLHIDENIDWSISDLDFVFVKDWSHCLAPQRSLLYNMSLNKIWNVIWMVNITGWRGTESALYVYVSNRLLLVDVSDKKIEWERRLKK
jgi:hypothetical protein